MAKTSPPDADRLEQLVRCWLDARRDGRPVTAEDLCRDAPDLLPELRRKLPTDGDADTGEYPPKPTPPPAGGPPRLDLVGCRYQVREHHDGGGMGDIFIAYDADLDRIVALKCMKEFDADRLVLRERFLREARITGMLE